MQSFILPPACVRFTYPCTRMNVKFKITLRCLNVKSLKQLLYGYIMTCQSRRRYNTRTTHLCKSVKPASYSTAYTRIEIYIPHQIYAQDKQNSRKDKLSASDKNICVWRTNGKKTQANSHSLQEIHIHMACVFA